MDSCIIHTNNSTEELQKVLENYGEGNAFFVLDENTSKVCFPKVQEVVDRYRGKVIIIPSGEKNKTVEKVANVWQFLQDRNATRKSVLVNMGGGMLSDLSGFAASTFKRGIDFVNVPTTLLSQVDASVGGKTGVNFNNLKNEIGVFSTPKKVIIDTGFLKTLTDEEFKSGFAEMLKHGLIHNREHYEELTRFDVSYPDYEWLANLVKVSVGIKQWVVEQDFCESGIRKTLNFGHTAGHAFETFAIEKDESIPHGYAVAYGMMVEMYLSSQKMSLSTNDLFQAVENLLGIYGKFPIKIDSHIYLERIVELMRHDKKNEGGKINFTLLNDIGVCAYDQFCEPELIDEALLFFKDLND
ncbi:MAG: 3-dehydroquinate synthase [Bacteroidales bacterium]